MQEYTLEELRKKIREANEAYRTGDAIMSDAQYDALIDELENRTEGSDPVLQEIGFEVSSDDSRKEKLPIPMYSMNKVKSPEELHKWASLKGMDPKTKMMITPKFDGLSLCALEYKGKAWTRGNGIFGQRSDKHYSVLMSSKTAVTLPAGYSFGEVVMPRSVFASKWAESYKNSRNMGAGALNKKLPEDELKDFEFMRFGWVPEDGERIDKSEQIRLLNERANDIELKHLTIPLDEIDEELLQETFQDFGRTFEIDGLIVEVDDAAIRAELGREKNGNPVYARAWKGFAEQEAITTVKNIHYQVSKNWLLKPVASIEPVELDGVTVRNVTLNNARYVRDMGLAQGAEVKVIRSGQVIPKIIDVVNPLPPELPTTCPSCGNPLKWNDTDVELTCTGAENCHERNIAAILAFFSILEVDNLGQGIVEQLYQSGYTSVSSILKMSVADFESLESFKEKKSRKLFESIQAKIKNVPLEKLMHASGLFEGLGSKKLALLKAFDSAERKPEFEDVVAIEGFSEISADAYLSAFDQFWSWASELPVTIAAVEKPSGSVLSEYRVCFTGFRDKELQALIEKNSGKVVSGVSAKTTHLVVKDPNSTSSKATKARDLGIPVLGREEFLNHLSTMGLSN